MDRNAACQYGAVLFKRKLAKDSIMRISSGLFGTIIDTNKGSIFCLSEKIHLVIVSR